MFFKNWIKKPSIHVFLANHVIEEYGIDTKFSDVVGWGYNSTSIYLNDTADNEYLIKFRTNTLENKASITKDIYFANYLKNEIPTVEYIPSKNSNYITEANNLLYTVHKFKQGVTPFRLTREIIVDSIPYFKRIHNFKVPSKREIELRQLLGNGDPSKYKLLHGDITPSNYLVAYNKVSAILDFEFMCIGPVEYDLASMIVFSWFRMETETYISIRDFIISEYDEPVNSALIYKYASNLLESRLTAIHKFKKTYKSRKDWLSDFNFTTSKLNELKSAS